MSDKLLQALISFAEGIAYCPCCEGIRKCEEGCTIEEDCEKAGLDAIRRYEDQMAARAALNTKED